jgi:hypothetical protein
MNEEKTVKEVRIDGIRYIPEPLGITHRDEIISWMKHRANNDDLMAVLEAIPKIIRERWFGEKE